MSKLYRLCPMCKRGHYIKLTNEQDRKLWEYRNGKGLIQELFPELNACEREFIKTGMCKECQELMFGNGESELIKER